MSLAYDEYLAEHISNVNKGLQWMLDNLGLSQEEKSAIEDAMTYEHDASKYDKEEYEAYDKYFYGGNQSYMVMQAFNYAWLHHIHNNPHHWQYWVLMEDDPELGMPYKPLMIPLPYIFEMIADWWTFSWNAGNLFEIFKWYGERRGKQIMHHESRKIVERILEKIWNVLIMQEAVAGHDISDIEGQYTRFWIEQKWEAIMEHSDTEDTDEGLYGIPEVKKYPMPDKKHVKSAIRFFNYVDPKYEKELAEAILEKAEEFGLKFGEDITVGDDNKFKKYLLEEEDHLEHHGILGQKWGIRRFQNYDGTLTEAGKEHYRKTVFVSGSSKTQTEDSPYYRKELPSGVKRELDEHIKNHDKILVGDAPGIDRQVQDYLNDKKYDGVEVYGPGKEVRYSANKNWKTNPIDAPEFEEGSKDWLAKKDIAMAKAADEGLAVILDEGAKATRKNIQRMLDDDKDMKVYQLDQNGVDLDRWIMQKELKDIIVRDEPTKSNSELLSNAVKSLQKELETLKSDKNTDPELIELIEMELEETQNELNLKHTAMTEEEYRQI